MPKPRTTTIALVLATVLAVGYVMFVPARNYVDQQAATSDAESQLARLDAEVAELEARRDALEDPATIERIARERFAMGYPGEQVYAVLPAPPPPLAIPAGWPYDILRSTAGGTVPTG